MRLAQSVHVIEYNVENNNCAICLFQVKSCLKQGYVCSSVSTGVQYAPHNVHLAECTHTWRTTVLYSWNPQILEDVSPYSDGAVTLPKR